MIVRLLVMAALQVISSTAASHVSLSEAGGYNGIVIRLRKELNQADCPALLKGIKVWK